MSAVVVGVALFFAAMGLVALVRPAFVVGRFGIDVDSVDGRNEVRAVYGGFGLAIAGLLAWSSTATAATEDAVLLAVAVALGGMAAGRVVSFVLERPRYPHPTATFLVVEVGLAAALLLSR